MTDIIEEARAMLARLNEGAFACGNAHANQQGERLLAALADECERLRAENARLREAMVDVAYSERCGAHEDTVEGTYTAYTRDEYTRDFRDELLARLDAAEKGR